MISFEHLPALRSVVLTQGNKQKRNPNKMVLTYEEITWIYLKMREAQNAVKEE